MAKFCVYCGKEVEEKDNVCGNCGKAINNNVQTIVTVKEKNKTDGLAIAGIIINSIMFVVLIILYIFMFILGYAAELY